MTINDNGNYDPTYIMLDIPTAVNTENNTFYLKPFFHRLDNTVKFPV
jgi:hypothetical protein